MLSEFLKVGFYTTSRFILSHKSKYKCQAESTSEPGIKFREKTNFKRVIIKMGKKVLFVLTSHGTLGETGKPTGWYLVSLLILSFYAGVF